MGTKSTFNLIKKWVIFSVLGCLVSCSGNERKKTLRKDHVEGYTLKVSQRIFLSELPDSLQPTIVYLADRPKPLTIAVPKKKGKSVRITGTKGQIQTIYLEPPSKYPLPALKDDAGKNITNAQGHPLSLAMGGMGNFTNYTTENGLPLDLIKCSLLDSRGYLWFGTNGGGVSRFDGQDFVNFSVEQGLAGNYIHSIFEDRHGKLWFGTAGNGVSCYDGHSFTNFSVDQGLPDNIVISITEDHLGNLWFGTSAGVGFYDGDTFTHFNPDQDLINSWVSDITEDHNNNLWFTTIRGAVRYDGNSFLQFGTAQGLVSDLIMTCFEDQAGNLWFGTPSGVSRYDGKSFTNFTQQQGLAHNWVLSIIQDNRGNIWFGTEGGVSCYNGQYFINYTENQGLANNEVNSISQDRNGNLWFGTYGDGVSRYEGMAFINFESEQVHSTNTISSLWEDQQGSLWLGTYGDGVIRFDGSSFTRFTTTQGMLSSNVLCVFNDRRGNLWFGSRGGGLSRYDGQTFTRFTTQQGLPHNTIYYLAEDRQGKLWIATDDGISCFDGKSFTNFTFKQGLEEDLALGITEDQNGVLWFANEVAGVSCFDGKSFTRFTLSQELSNNFVEVITKDNHGNLWIGMTQGLGFLNAEQVRQAPTKAELSLKVFTKRDGLPNNTIAQICLLPNEKIAVGTNQGIATFNAPAKLSKDFVALTGLEVFNITNGYQIRDVNNYQNALLLDRKGVLWASTGSKKNALIRLDYQELHRNKTTPLVKIRQIKINEQTLSWPSLKPLISPEDSTTIGSWLIGEANSLKKPLTEEERHNLRNQFAGISFHHIQAFSLVPMGLVIPYRFNRITFDFNTNELARPNLIEYQYWLEGRNNSWSPALNQNFITFDNIWEGHYTLRVRARYTGLNESGAGNWGKEIKYQFRILPPWWRSWWANTLYIAIITGLGYLFLRSQKARIINQVQLKNQARELEQAKKIEQTYLELAKSHEALKSTQAQLIQSEKLASLGELTAGIAHEIQNPLNFVNNFAEVSAEMLDEMHEELEKGDTNEAIAIATDLKTNLEKINHHGQRASSIVKGMLEHSRSSTGVKEPTDLNALADEYLRLAYHGLRAKDNNFNANIETHFDPDLPKVSVIPQDIGRVLLNLINNAFYALDEKQKQMATGKSGTPLSESFRLSESYTPTISIRTKLLDNAVEIRIQDNGNGIPEAIRDKIFQPFFTTKPTGQGTGLGLSLAYDIVTKGHGGNLEAVSNEGEGSEFILRLLN